MTAKRQATPTSPTRTSTSPRPKTILDVTISCPTCPTYVCNAAAAPNDHCTKLAEKNKHTKYDDLASKLECRVVAAAFTTYGGWGDNFTLSLHRAARFACCLSRCRFFY